MSNKVKILNLYAGIGGNRKLWGDEHDITAVEFDENIAKVYQSYFPNDKVIIADAHQYLLEHYKEFDFIWASPPCPTHSDIRRCGVHKGQCEAVYPEMSLYQEIILCKNFLKKDTLFCIENVIPYYEPLIPATKKLHRHLYWSNFNIYDFQVTNNRKHEDIRGNSELYGFNIKNSNIKDKIKSLRNCVDPELGKHILDCALNSISGKSEQLELFNLKEN